ELTEDEINNYYNDNIFGDMTVRHILIKPDVASDASDEDKKKAEEKALKEAKELIKKLDNGEKFEDLAKKESDDEGTKEDGGLLKDFSKDSVVSEFWDASYKLKDNEYTKEPVKSEYGYHIILRVSQKKKPALKEVKDTIEDTLVSEKISNDSNIEKETWKKIRKKYNLEIEDSEIKSGYKSLTK
ncbi:MAG: peptidylprolyl isomerase, partial [Firmicutes bacterium]|nr:peptidylprolyl isomerase [Bacillota bacterium]